MTLIEIFPSKITEEQIDFLHRLLAERRVIECISHTRHPSRDEHRQFLLNETTQYRAHFIIADSSGRSVGTTYVTWRNEIGIHLMPDYRRMGIGGAAVKRLMDIFGNGLSANCNPQNEAAIEFFKSMGFRPLQLTLVRDK
jgi:RimJ/RimL family protein N-acetyltransferase